MTGGSSERTVSVFRQILLGLEDTRYPQALRTLLIEQGKGHKEKKKRKKIFTLCHQLEMANTLDVPNG